MSSDYFSDLVPSKPATDDADLLGGMSEESPVHALPFQPRTPIAKRSTSEGSPGDTAAGLPSLSKEEASSANEQASPFVPMGEGRAKREARELQLYLEKLFGRFAADVKSAMELQSKQLGVLEGRVAALDKSVTAATTGTCTSAEASAKQIASLQDALRDVSLGLQLLRDRQELADTHMELSKVSATAVTRPFLASAPSNAAVVAPHTTPVVIAAPLGGGDAVAQAVSSQPVPPVAVRASAPAPAPPAPLAPSPAAHVAPAQVEQQPQPVAHPQPAPSSQQQLPQQPSQPQQAQQLAPSPQQQQQQQPEGVSGAAQASAVGVHPHHLPPAQYAAAPTHLHSQLQQLQQPAAYQQQQAQQQPPYAPLLRSSSGSSSRGGAHPTVPFSVPPQLNSPAPYNLPPYSVPHQQPHQLSSAPPYAPSGHPGVHPHMQQQHQQGLPPQYAPQPPLPPRIPQKAAAQGLWRGPQPEPYRMPSGETPGASSGRHGSRGGPPRDSITGQPPAARDVPLESVIDEVASMGFSRHEVRGTVVELMDSGKAVDLNVVLDRLMNR